MPDTLGQVRRFWRWYRRAQTCYQVHSPFVYDLCRAALEDDRHRYAFDDIEQLRRRLLRSSDTLEMTDYGAGSRVAGTTTRRLAQVARDSANAGARGELLFRLVDFLKPAALLEMGTSLGIGTLYQKFAARRARMISLEGCPQTADRARHHLEVMQRSEVDIRIGPFDETLPAALADLGRVDWLFNDGDHRYEPTLRYFKTVLPYLHPGSVLVFDDIHWSDGMERAWRELRTHPRVRLSVDFYHCGLLFFREDRAAVEHFDLAPVVWKPWMSLYS